MVFLYRLIKSMLQNPSEDLLLEHKIIVIQKTAYLYSYDHCFKASSIHNALESFKTTLIKGMFKKCAS